VAIAKLVERAISDLEALKMDLAQLEIQQECWRRPKTDHVRGWIPVEN
jgi:hypothetical protein